MLSLSLTLGFKKIGQKIEGLTQNLSICLIASCCLIMPWRALATSQTTAIKISSCTELQNITAGDYVLTADIDCSGRNFRPIGTTPTGVQSVFKGSLDGAGHKINNISIITSDKSMVMVGLFSMTDKASIKDLTLNNIKITGRSIVGTLIGFAIKTTVDNVKVQQGTITIPDSIPNAYPSFIGGLVGILGSVSSIQKSSCFVTVQGNSASSYVGGLVGSIKNSSTIDHSYAVGSVEGKNVVGGLIGSMEGGKLNNSYAEETVKSYSDSAGGLVGDSYKGQVSNSYALGSVSGQRNIGGLIGGNYEGQVLNSYALGSVNGQSNTGGLVGITYGGTIKNAYSAGKIFSMSDSGGLIGKSVNPAPNILSSYWDIESTGQSNSAGGIRKTTAQMHQQSTYKDWDFINIWGIQEGKSYPFLLNPRSVNNKSG